VACVRAREAAEVTGFEVLLDNFRFSLTDGCSTPQEVDGHQHVVLEAYRKVVAERDEARARIEEMRTAHYAEIREMQKDFNAEIRAAVSDARFAAQEEASWHY